MYDFGTPMGESCYRLISRTGSFIYLKTRGMLEIDEETREVRSFVCVNTLVTDEEGRRLIKEMKRKFSAIISEAELNAMENNVVMDVENPQLLERAILNLITNLNNHAYDDDDTASVISDISSRNDSKSSKGPLAIIAPNTESVKPTVFNSLDVITQVRGKKDVDVQIKDEPLSPDTCASSSSSSNSSSVMASTAAAAAAESNASQQYVKVEPNCNILSPTSSFSVSSRDSDVSSPQSLHNSNNNGSYQRTTITTVKTSEFYSNYENHHNNTTTNTLQQSQIFDIDTQASHHRNSSCDSFSSNHSTTAAMATTIDTNANVNNNNNQHRSSVLKRTHESNDDDDIDNYNEMLKRRMLSSDLSPISQNPPLELLAITPRSG